MRVIIESPFKGYGETLFERERNEQLNKEYLQECILDCLDREEAPFASHQMYTNALNDSVPFQRTWGIVAGFEWGDMADKVVVYYDRGISSGMKLGIQRYSMDKIIEFRSIYEI